jgi:membrane protease subunit HflK
MPSFFRGNAIIVLLVIVVLGWLSSGFYRVNTQQEGVVLRFGEWVKTTPPGLHYHWPYPIETVLTPEVTRDNRINIGFRSTNDGGSSTRRDLPFESEMITGDENIVDIDFVVFWRIGEAGNYLFNLTDPEETTKVAAEAVMREIVGRVDIQFALTDGREQIQAQAKQQLQKLLDEYEAGIIIREVQLLAVDPPVDVIDAFNEVQRARQDRDRLKNEAEAYSNGIIPRARGEAAQIIAEAEAYAEQIVNKAEGDASRFTQVYEAYLVNKDITKERIYLETLEDIMSNVDKIIIDDGAGGSGVIPYLPLSEIGKAK